MLRTEIAEMITLAERLEKMRQPAVLTTLFSAVGSTYRPLGSMMVSGPGSRFMAGGVSGGCLEEYVARRGRELVEHTLTSMLSFESDPYGDRGSIPTLGCGGSIQVLVERCTIEHLQFLRQLLSASEAETCSTVACIVDKAARGALRTRRFWLNKEPEDDLRSGIYVLHERAIAERRSQHGEIGPSLAALIHYIRPAMRLVIFGAGNDACPLSSIAHSLGWHVTIVDRRARLASKSRFPSADQVIAADWWDAIQRVTLTQESAVVVMTHSLTDDIEILTHLADTRAKYVGVLGPEHRRNWVLQGVAEQVAKSETFASRLRGPIGLDLGDRSPTGISVSILSEILAVMNERTAAPRTVPLMQVAGTWPPESAAIDA